MKATPSSTAKKVFLWIGGIFLFLILVFVLAVLAIRTPWAQQFITDKAVSFVSGKTGTKMDIEKLFITFRGDVQLEGVYLEDTNADTLVYMSQLEAGVVFLPLINGNINISRVNWNGLVANVERYPDSTFNFNFLIDAFSSKKKDAPEDTASGRPIKLAFGPLDFNDFDLHYRDEVIGLEGNLLLGKLQLDPDEIDIENLDFEVDELVLHNVTGSLHQWLPSESSDTSTATQQPRFKVGDVDLKNINFSYRSEPDTFDLKVDLQKLLLDEAEVDLETQHIAVGEIDIDGTTVELQLPAASNSEKPEEQTDQDFSLPDWKIEFEKLNLNEIAYAMKLGNEPETKRQFNVNDMRFTGLKLRAEDGLMESKKLQLEMNELSFSEKSGMRVENLDFELDANDDRINLKALDLTTPYNRLKTDASVSYSSLAEFFSTPENGVFELNLSEADLSIEDAYFFAPQLKTDTLLAKISSNPVRLSGHVSGKLDDLSISDLKLSALNSLRLTMSGSVKGLPDTSNIRVNLPDLNIFLTRKDLAFVMEDEQISSIPDSIKLNGNIAGNTKKLQAKLNLKTNAGRLKLDGVGTELLGNIGAEGKLELVEFDVNKIAAVADLQPVSLVIDFNSKGKTLETLVADASVQFQQLNFKSYDYSNLSLTASVADQKAKVKLNHADENLDFELLVDAVIDTLNPQAELTLDLTGANFYELGLSPQKIRFGTELTANYSGLPSNFQSSLSLTQNTLIRDNAVFRPNAMNIDFSNAKNSTKLAVKSDIVNGQLDANTSLDTLVGSVSNYVKKLVSADSLRAGIMNDSLDISAHFTVRNSRILTEALLPKLQQFDSIRLDLEFHPQQEQLSLNLSAPQIVYSDFTLDSLGMNAAANGELLSGALAFRSIKGGQVNIDRTRLKFGFQNKVASIDLAINDSIEQPLFAIGVEIDVSTPTTEMHINPDRFTLNGDQWSIPAENKISLQEGGVLLQSVHLNNAPQSVRLDNLKSGGKNGMKVSFDGFELASITSIVNGTDSLLDGQLNGTVRLVNLNQTPGIESDLQINQLTALGINLGKLKLLANNKTENTFNIDFSIKGEPIDLTVKGSLKTVDELVLDATMNLNRLDVSVAERFAQGQFKEASGFLRAESTVNGPVSELKYKGALAFDNAKFTLTQLNAPLTLSDDRIEIDNKGLVLKNFDLRDKNGKKLSVNGTVKTESLLDPEFNLKITADNFQPLNSTREDSELFFGKAFVDLDLDVKGSLSIPRVKAQAKLKKGTDITFIVPESQAAIEERKGLVRFKNMRDTLNAILQVEETIETPLFEGLDLIGYLEIDPATQFKIIIDERSGDNIQIQGEAKLNVEVTPNGITTLSGNYEIVGGKYDMKFYGLARRKFELISGSRISWSGDPLEGRLDLQAKYEVKASASDLMADQLSQSDASTQNQYRQALPFQVILNVDGQLLQPEISFAMDMPENSRQALSGNVYKRIRQLNNTQSELEKQVFSLIVLGRFLPQNFDQADGNGTEGMARSSVSKLLSNQLNKYSSKYLKGVEVNIDLNSYTDYQTGQAQGRTDLGLNVRKALFNDRLVVQVGGQVAVEGSDRSYGVNDILGDVSLEYLITREGQYRLKAFRENEFQDLVQGQVVVTGLSVLFNKSYNTWKELFAKIPKEDLQIKKKEKAKEEEEVESTEEELENKQK